MRLQNWCATALATGAFFANGAVAESYAFTTTIYVERVKTATGAWPSSVPPGIMLYSTSSGGGGASPTAAPLLSVNAAAAVGVEKVGLAAVAGLVGLVVL